MGDSILDIFYELSPLFLGSIVQQQKLSDEGAPEIHIEDGLPKAVLDSVSEEPTDWVTYLLGYVILLGVGALFVLAIPISGLIFCCCRNCCKKCCIETNPKDGKRTRCARICCGVFLFIFTLIVALGCALCVIATFKLWQETKSDGGALDKVNNYIYSLESYPEDTIKEAEDVLVTSYETTYSYIIDELDSLGEDALNEVGTLTNVEPLLEQLYNFTNAIPEMEESLNNASALSDSLDSQAQALSAELDVLTAAVIADAELCTSILDECSTTKLMAEALEVQVDYGLLPSLDFAILSLQVAVANDIEGMVDDAIASYYGIAESINETWQKETQRLEEELGDLSLTLVNATDDLTESVPEIDLSSVTGVIDQYQDDVETYGDYWFYASLGFSGILVAICLCYLLGLCMGMCCKLPSKHKSRSCTTRHAARSLLFGVTLTFVFTWLHMLVTMVMFVSGGLSYTEVCRYISPLSHSSPAINVIDDVFPHLPIKNLTLSSVLDSCEDNLSLYQTLALNESDFNTSHYLDLDAIEQSLKEFRSNDFEVNVTLVSQELNDTLKIVSTGLDSINFTYFYTILDANVTTIDLNDFAAQLERTANALTIESLSDMFRDHALASELLYNTSVLAIESDADEMTEDLEFVEETRDDADLSNLVVELSIAQDELNTHGGDMIGEIANDTAATIYDTLVNLTEAMAYSIKYEVGRCGVVYDAMAGVVAVACEDVLDPYNLAWVAQGWTLIILVPSLAIAVRMARFYRKNIRHNAIEDITTNQNDNNNNTNMEHVHPNEVVLVTQNSVQETETFHLEELNGENNGEATA